MWYLTIEILNMIECYHVKPQHTSAMRWFGQCKKTIQFEWASSSFVNMCIVPLLCFITDSVTVYVLFHQRPPVSPANTRALDNEKMVSLYYPVKTKQRREQVRQQRVQWIHKKAIKHGLWLPPYCVPPRPHCKMFEFGHWDPTGWHWSSEHKYT